MRIKEHPILSFNREKRVKFTFNEKVMEGFEGETIAAALHANGIKELGKSIFKHRPRGFYCAIGNCASCLMIVDGEPNVRTCTTMLKEGMVIRTQNGKGDIL